MKTRHVIGGLIAAAVIAFIAGGFGLWLGITISRTRPPAPDAAYHAVLLTNGEVYYGQLAGFGSEFPTLTDVYYAQRRRSASEATTQFTLVKRGREWHKPDRLIFNASQIVLVEPVGSDSEVAKFIAELKKE
jgi:hypothetical protein